MSLISVARNADRWLGFDLGRADGHVAQAVVVIDPATGEAGAPGLTDAQLRDTPVPPADSLGGTRTHNTAGGIRQAVGATSARVALPTLSASRELYVMATNRCFFLTGDSSAAAVNTTGLTNMSHPLAADERFYFRVPAGHTHIAYIRDSADGFISIMPVA